MKNLAHFLYLSENSIEKTLKLTTGQALKDSINFVGHPGILFLWYDIGWDKKLREGTECIGT